MVGRHLPQPNKGWKGRQPGCLATNQRLRSRWKRVTMPNWGTEAKKLKARARNSQIDISGDWSIHHTLDFKLWSLSCNYNHLCLRRPSNCWQLCGEGSPTSEILVRFSLHPYAARLGVCHAFLSLVQEMYNCPWTVPRVTFLSKFKACEAMHGLHCYLPKPESAIRKTILRMVRILQGGWHTYTVWHLHYFWI